MHTKKYSTILVSLTICFIAIIFSSSRIYALEETVQKITQSLEESSTTEEGPAGNKTDAVVKKITVEIKKTEEIQTPEEAIQEELKKETEEKKEEIKQGEKDLEKAKTDAENIIEDKVVLEKEAAVKEHAAAVAVQELKVIKKEAETKKDPETLAKAKKLAEEVQKAKAESELYKEKIKIVEFKAETAQKKLEARQAKMTDLKEDYEQLRIDTIKHQSIFYKSQKGLLILVSGLFLLFLLRFSLARAKKLLTKKDAIRETEQVLHLKTILALFRWLGSLIIFGLIVFFVLDSFGFNMAPLLAGAGIIGLAFGFGGQYLIRDIINGIFILLEGQYRINDVIKINDTGGLVENITLRVTKLRDLEGRVIYIPNGEIKSVINFTQEYAQALLNIGVAYKENVDRVMDVIKQVGVGMRQDPHYGRLILQNLEMLGVDDFADSQVTIKFRIKTLAMKQWEVAREFRRRLKNKFDELGIEIPFPHRTVYLGTGPDNDWIKDWAFKEGTKKEKGE
ncbi:MAG: mechanosensitive ion channel [Candidatus Ancaeobacter aquaticus]|nr:mechanosensitive ion channel [Candidatus Ancaeobacter aquaticus]